MEFTATLSYLLLAVAAVALVVFFVTWSRRSKPTETQPAPIRDEETSITTRLSHSDPLTYETSSLYPKRFDRSNGPVALDSY